MKNIDRELTQWAIQKIKTEYPQDVALLIGQEGACKLPTDQQNMVFDFFVPDTERGNCLSRTFIIEDMGYDLYPISWERLEGIADLQEPRMIFAFDKGEIIYARAEEDRQRFLAIKEKLHENLSNRALTFEKGLEFLNTAMEIFQTMLFEDSMCKARKAAGGISCYLMNALAMQNGTYLQFGYENLSLEMKGLRELPQGFSGSYERLLREDSILGLREICYEMIRTVRDFFADRKQKKAVEGYEINYDDLADWYQEARYTFRKIEYYGFVKDAEQCFMLGCYLQIEFDAICVDFDLTEMDLLGEFDAKNLERFAERAKNLEEYLLRVLKEHKAQTNIFSSFEEFCRG